MIFLVDFGYLLTKEISLMTCVNVIKNQNCNSNNWTMKEEIKSRGEKWLQMNHIKAFYAVTANQKLAEGQKIARI